MNSVAQTNTGAPTTSPSAPASQVETLARRSGPRSDGGANIVWDTKKQKFVLLDLYLWDRVTQINPSIVVNRSPKLTQLKVFLIDNFNIYSELLFTTKKEWYLVRDIDLSQYQQCQNAAKLYVKKFVAACQTTEFVFIDAKLFDALDGDSQDGIFLHEYGVGHGQKFGWYANDEKRDVVEFRIQRFVGSVINMAYTVDSVKAFWLNVSGSTMYTKAELEIVAQRFHQVRASFCEALPKPTVEINEHTDYDIYVRYKKLVDRALEYGISDDLLRENVTTQEILKINKHPAVARFPMETHGVLYLNKFFSLSRASVATYIQRAREYCSP